MIFFRTFMFYVCADNLLVTFVSWRQTMSASKESKAFLIPPLKVLMPFMFHVKILMVLSQSILLT